MASPKTTLPSYPWPKDEMMSDSLSVKAHKALIERMDFQNSLRTAMAQYTRMMCSLSPTSLDSPNQLQGSAMCFQRIQGMNDFVKTFLTLADTPRLPERRDTDNLTH